MTFREKVSRLVIDPETRDRRITAAYMALAVLALMHHVYVTVYFPFPENGAIPFRFAWVILAGVTAVLGRMWKDWGSRILTALLLIKILRVAIPSPELVSETQTVYENCIYAFYICYGCGRVFSRKDRETFISLFCALWTLAMVVYSCIGLYVVFSGNAVPNLGTRPFELNIYENRLWPVYHPVEAGTMAALSIAAALIGFFITKRKALRALYIPAVLVIFLMNVFCISRTSYILTAMGISAPAAMLLYELLQRGKRQGKTFTLLRTAAAFAAFAAAAGLVLLLQMKAIPAYNALRSGGGLIPAAMAEEAQPAAAELTPRAFVTEEGADGFLTGRLAIWIHCCSGISHFPIYALTGAGVYDPMEHINTYIRAGLALQYIYHLHSTFIQTLWESGIPGFLLFVSFFGIFSVNAVRLIRNRSLPMWQRLIPLPALLCWLADMVDCGGYCNWGKPPMTLLYLFTGLTVVLAHAARSDARDAEGKTAGKPEEPLNQQTQRSIES